MHYRIGKRKEDKVDFHSIKDAKAAWESEAPKHAVFEICDNETYREALDIHLVENQSLQLRAAEGFRPTICLADSGEWARVKGNDGSRLLIDGLTISGKSLNIEGGLSEISIRHSTLVPAKGESLIILNCNARTRISNSIVGTIQIKQNEVRFDPINIEIEDSILDSLDHDQEAFGSDGEILAHARLLFRRSTVIGYVETHEIELAQDSIFYGRVTVGNEQLGQMRFCYIDTSLRGGHCTKTPSRYRCQPDPEQTFQPDFSSLTYGRPNYCQLGPHCPNEIKQGAESQSEIGVFHDLFEPQRRIMVEERLKEFTPTESQVALIFAT